MATVCFEATENLRQPLHTKPGFRALLDCVSKAIGQKLCLSRESKTEALEANHLYRRWQLHFGNALIEGVPVATVVFRKRKNPRKLFMKRLFGGNTIRSMM